MKDLVLDIITSYEERLASVEKLVTSAYEEAASSDGGFLKAQDEAEKLREVLKETLARNCSLRRKDFEHLMADTFDRIEVQKWQIEEERKRIRERLAIYLARQKEVIVSLRDELARFISDESSRDRLKALLDGLKASSGEEDNETLSSLGDFHLQVSKFCREQELLNSKLQRLARRGKYLRLEDLRQLEAIKDRKQRRDERVIRREDVERLLNHFGGERREVSRNMH